MPLLLCTNVPDGPVLRKPDLDSFEHLMMIPREVAEGWDSFRQIVVYCVLRRGGTVYVYRRGGSEERLSDLFSIGVGGHVELQDVFVDHETGEVDLNATVLIACKREINEEVEAKAFTARASMKHMIVSSDSEVDRCHLGLVFEFSVPDHVEIEPKSELRAPFWARIEDLNPEKFESWSQILIDYYMRVMWN